MIFLSTPSVYFLPGTWESVSTNPYDPVFGLISFSAVTLSVLAIFMMTSKRSKKKA
jgi:hypothetical protein